MNSYTVRDTAHEWVLLIDHQQKTTVDVQQRVDLSCHPRICLCRAIDICRSRGELYEGSLQGNPDADQNLANL